ncbi:MAG TPA: ATPase [Rhodospirillaceae bacterium]|nr:ATPase [Rhodospirillaceae bacterium]
MENPRVIGHIVAVQGFRVKVEVLPETRSASRATLDGVQKAIAINAYLTFAIGAGQLVIGIITDLESRESFDPGTGDELTLELMKPRRVAHVQLLGTIEVVEGRGLFSPGITVLPTLDAPAEIGAPEILKSVFDTPPTRNRPDGYAGDDFDCELRIGCPTGQPNNVVKASYNDLFSRPLAIVGNTGSGKSFSVSSLVQKAMAALGKAGNEPHVFILDINGEYGRAFGTEGKSLERKPDHIYLNGRAFGIPIWFLNAMEICAWLSAAEQTQEPVLKDWWAIAKTGNPNIVGGGTNLLRHAITKANNILQTLDAQRAPYKKTCLRQLKILKDYVGKRVVNGLADLEAKLAPYSTQYNASGNNLDWDSPENEADIRAATEAVITSLKALIAQDMDAAQLSATTADSPLNVPKKWLIDPTLLDSATPAEEVSRIEAHLSTLKLRLKTRLDDPRWQAFMNYEAADTTFTSLKDWMERFGLGKQEGPKVSILDLSMLSHEVLPYACTVFGRVLLEARENLPAARRYKHPWVLVLEEAHNYVRPPRTDEQRGQMLSRLAFERIAKEGRKFGLSLIIASQRPSEISQTIISQCANFISHRLQNPDDIDHFKRIIPMQARRLLDQVTILASGEAIVFGSAFHVPARVQFDRPEPGPYSQTAAPYHEWKTEQKPFPLDEVVNAWGLNLLQHPETVADDTP